MTSLFNKKKILLLSATIVLLFFLILTTKEKVFAPYLSFKKSACVPTFNELLSVTNPKPKATIAHDFFIEGKARGVWYFEASFPITVIDKNGTVLATSYGKAQGSWMTNDFVPFTAHITIPQTTTDDVCIILAKDNPSGLPEKDASIKIPVTLSQ